MRSLLWLLALFVLAAGIALLAHFNDGYVLLVFPPYRAELSLNLALILIVTGFAALYALLRSLAVTLSFPQRVREFHEKRRRERAVNDFQDALRFLFEGRFSRALQKAGAAYAAGHSPSLSALLAAHAAQHLRAAQTGSMASPDQSCRAENAASTPDARSADLRGYAPF
ncbi:heme biosynthesis HemY N-terminal domain-containing protein [bacterium]|nr:heme biosynthesis HemY N-terminal domain-containing protein [bacterium]